VTEYGATELRSAALALQVLLVRALLVVQVLLVFKERLGL
jgi:hypothetical protein